MTGLLARARGGESAVLVIRGEAGVGKTALLRYAAEQASDFRLAEITGVESEMELAYAALHQLCSPMLDRLPLLPGPQREALATAFGMHDGPPPDQFLVGLAVVFAMLASYGLSRTLTPVIIGLLLKGEHHGETDGAGNWFARFHQGFERGFELFRRGYVRVLTLLLKRRTSQNIV